MQVLYWENIPSYSLIRTSKSSWANSVLMGLLVQGAFDFKEAS